MTDWHTTIDLGDGRPLVAHPLRAPVVNELHARPAFPLEAPCRIVHLAFMADEAAARRDRDALAGFCAAAGVAEPASDARYHRVVVGRMGLRWERHTEFVTYTFDISAEPGEAFTRPRLRGFGLGEVAPQPGPVLVAVEVGLVGPGEADTLAQVFDPASLCVSELEDGAALAATDFRADAAGFTRILAENRALTPGRAGALIQTLLEIETYRTIAMLALPEAQRISPEIRRIETALAEVGREMTRSAGLESNRRLLARLTDLAAELEAQAAATSYRFGASRAYAEIVRQRLDSLRERPAGGHAGWAPFLWRRMAPAMRTAQAVEDRQTSLSTKLARSANLLRTRVDIELESQNRDLLAAMNRRTQLQLRLQQTVEGLSVAAVSYYVVGLVGYAAKGVKTAGLPLDPELVMAVTVPLALVALALVVRRIRRRHRD
jgi:uncharacterized membrane-anchored protein